ncbi:Rossmann fold domain-containing protein [Aurantiacibacter sp. D1-12]|uniref:Rossmann fold domain-containing protein n=1 Tax=Aurantiacibacter sp. D1-12 TaxID=2993658 RepID=UPI00237D2146|nr:hypothetical protein [Aurantiacibacter sp. D1-12]MDE1467864.1 hypothetical protein [Aurantiacibacter sp. D1-12]
MTRNDAIIEVVGLPAAPLDAAAAFHREWVPKVRGLMQENNVVVIFDPADHTHQGWRLSAVQELAREAAPQRVNGVESEDAQAVSETLFYLQSADGVTGQIFTLAE